MMACLQSNPDISGIGVRVSIYTQALLTLVPAFVFSADGITTPQEYESMKVTTHTTLLSACAILLCAFIQVAQVRLSVYHALIVLNLSWINNTNALVYIIFFVFAHHTLTLDFGLWEVYELVKRLARDSKARYGIILASVHLCAIGVIGLLVWRNIEMFGDQPECTPETHIPILGFSISVIDKRLRTFSLALYSLMVVPFVNILFFSGFLGFFAAAPAFCVDFLIHRYAEKNPKGFFTRRYHRLLHDAQRLKGIYHKLPSSKSRSEGVYKEAYESLFEARAEDLNNKIRRLLTMFPTGTANSHKIRKYVKAIRDVARASNAHDQEIFRIASFGGLLFITLVGIYFLVETEVMIARSRGLVQAGESDWTFGQTLAVVLVVVPLIDSTKAVITSIRVGRIPDMVGKKISFVSPRGLQLLSKSPDIRLDNHGLHSPQDKTSLV